MRAALTDKLKTQEKLLCDSFAKNIIFVKGRRDFAVEGYDFGNNKFRITTIGWSDIDMLELNDLNMTFSAAIYLCRCLDAGSTP